MKLNLNGIDEDVNQRYYQLDLLFITHLFSTEVTLAVMLESMAATKSSTNIFSPKSWMDKLSFATPAISGWERLALKILWCKVVSKETRRRDGKIESPFQYQY